MADKVYAISKEKGLVETNLKATGGVTTILDTNLTAKRALISDSNGKVVVSPVTDTELGYLDGVTSAIQTQLDGKLGKTAYAYGATRDGNGNDIASTYLTKSDYDASINRVQNFTIDWERYKESGLSGSYMRINSIKWGVPKPDVITCGAEITFSINVQGSSDETGTYTPSITLSATELKSGSYTTRLTSDRFYNIYTYTLVEATVQVVFDDGQIYNDVCVISPTSWD